MARGWQGPIEKLSDAYRAYRLLWALCLNCGHSKRMDPRHVIVLAGDVALRDLAKRLKCDRCKQRRAFIIPHDEEWPGR